MLAACGGDSNPAAPSGPVRFTETFSLTAILRPDGTLVYPTGTQIPTIVVHQAGFLEAKVSLTPVAGCEFSFSLIRGTVSQFAELRAVGPGPELAFQGTVVADTYRLALGARSTGVSGCVELSSSFVVVLPHTIVVTHT